MYSYPCSNKAYIDAARAFSWPQAIRLEIMREWEELKGTYSFKAFSMSC
jgi:hypothetical protein